MANPQRRTKGAERQIQEGSVPLREMAQFGVESLPGVGEALAIKRTSDALGKGDYVGAGIEATAGLLGVVPGVGDLAGKGLRTATKAFRKADVEEAEKLIDNPEKLQKWRDTLDKGGNRLPESQRQKNIPEAEQAAEDLFQGNIKSKEARKRIKEVFPEPELYTAETMPEMPTITDVVGSVGKKSEKGILGVKGFDLEPGQRVGARLDIPAYNEYDKWVVSIHDGNSSKGKVVGYGQAIRLKNIEFGSDPKIALDIARKKVTREADPVKGISQKRMGKATIARVLGDYVPEDPYELQEFARKILADKDSSWTQVGMNPYRGSYFYDKATGTPVTRADEVIQVGPLVLAKNVTKPKMSELKEMFKPVARTAGGKLRIFNEGGAVPMNNMAKQMELFDEGGLMDEGGTIDPVSGNDVPPGSTQEEVRDDIPAQLSEGEFVFPADVVRFIGLEKLMKIRQRAKAGLRMMEEMGQMGNSEEAIMPDDLPFSIDDLDMEDDGLEMAQGGVVSMANGGSVGSFVKALPGPNLNLPSQTGLGSQIGQIGTFNPRIPGTAGMNPLGTAPAPMQAASSLSLPPPTSGIDPNLGGTSFIPTTSQPIQQQPFQQAVGPVSQTIGNTPVTYINEAGVEKTFFVRPDGSIVDPSTGEVVDPATLGFSKKPETATQPTTGTGVQTAKVADDGDGGGDNDGRTPGASISLGGKKVGPALGLGIPGTRYAGPSRKITGSTIFDLSFERTGTLNPLSFVASMISKDGKLAPEGIARIGLKGRTDPRNTVRINAGDFNIIRDDLTGNLAKAYQDAGNLTEGLDNGSIVYNNDTKQLEDLDGNKIDMTEYTYTDEFGNTVTTTGLDKLGEGIYQDIEDKRNQTNWSTGKNYTDAEIGRGLTNAQKAANRAYIDSQFANFVDDDYTTTPSTTAPAPASSVFGTDYSGPPQDEGPGGDNTNDGPQGDEATGGSVGDDMYSGDG